MVPSTAGDNKLIAPKGPALRKAQVMVHRSYPPPTSAIQKSQFEHTPICCIRSLVNGDTPHSPPTCFKSLAGCFSNQALYLTALIGVRSPCSVC